MLLFSTGIRVSRWSGTSLLLMTVLLSCTSQKGFFSKKTPHEKYSEGLQSAGLNQTELGRQWLTAAGKSLSQPLTITLPYKETGYFAPEKPVAAGYRFSVRRGERVVIKVTTVPVTGILVFTELWQAGAGAEAPKLLATADTLTRQLEYEADKESGFVLRLQPELLKGIEYSLTITIQPSLAFPVRSSGNPRIISTWGMDRDGGSRSHEGIDIAATFRTPAIAAADGYVTSVSENNLGGKVVFMRPSSRNYNLYYAHLDSQIARPGQQVKEGDILGLVGKTGNARNTVPHLHFGIYTGSGAIDPLPFVNPDKPAIPPVTASLKVLNQFVRNTAATVLYNQPSVKGEPLEKLEANRALEVMSATGSWYKVRLPDNREGFINGTTVTATPVRTLNIKQETRLLDAPDPLAAAKKLLPAGARLSISGQYGAHYLVQHDDDYGWIAK